MKQTHGSLPSNCPTWVHAHKDTHCSNKKIQRLSQKNLANPKILLIISGIFFPDTYGHNWWPHVKSLAYGKLKPTACIMDYLDLMQKIKCELHNVHFFFLIFKYWHMWDRNPHFNCINQVKITLALRMKEIFSPKYCYLSLNCKLFRIILQDEYIEWNAHHLFYTEHKYANELDHKITYKSFNTINTKTQFINH